jgi:hypothetical protein
MYLLGRLALLLWLGVHCNLLPQASITTAGLFYVDLLLGRGGRSKGLFELWAQLDQCNTAVLTPCPLG